MMDSASLGGTGRRLDLFLQPNAIVDRKMTTEK